MKSCLTAFILVLAFAGAHASTNSSCTISCPKNCRFGVVLDRSDTNCAKCVCSDNKCAQVKCAGRCEVTKTKDCWESQCILATTACRPRNTAPKQSLDTAVTPPPTTIPSSVPRCLQDQDRGPCRARFDRHFFNKTSGQCELFFYGGCGGNENRFMSLSDCNTQCDEHIKLARTHPVNTCQLDSETGNCRARFQKYFFNRHTGKCQVFTYGGCGGNNNRFDTLAECDARCGVKKPKCLLPKSQGRCLAFIPRFYYDVTTMKCERFIFGGCEANENNFETIQSCINECSDMSIYPIEPKCKLPAEPGNCRALIPKYFFNTRTNACEKFNYGGCGGNENRFDGLDECNNKCFNLKSNE